MEVNTLNLKAEIDKFNILIERYEDIYLNLYNEINNSSFFWNDNNALLFFDDTKLQKIKIRQSINELKDLKNIYNYIYDSYIEFGRIIKFNLENSSKIIELFNIVNEKIKNIFKECSHLDINYCPEITNIMNKNYKLLENMQSNLLILKKSTRETFEKIEEIEKEVAYKLSNINIQYLQENNIETYM